MPDSCAMQILEKMHNQDHGSARDLIDDCSNIGITVFQMHSKAVKTILKCPICNTRKQAKSDKTTAPQKPIPQTPWEDCGADICQHGQGAGAIYFLIVVDNFTRCIWGTRVRSTASKAATAALSTLWSVTGTPTVIRTDNGTTFSSEAFRQFCELLNISQQFISPGNSRANGVNEAAVKRWQTNLRKLDVNFDAIDDDDLDTSVSMANILCNIRKVNGSQMSPYYACLGRTPAVLYGARIPRYKIKTANERLKRWHEEICQIQEDTFKNIIERGKKKKKFTTVFRIGDVVRKRQQKSKFTKGSWTETRFEILSVKNNCALLTPIIERERNLKFSTNLCHTRFLKKSARNEDDLPLVNKSGGHADNEEQSDSGGEMGIEGEEAESNEKSNNLTAETSNTAVEEENKTRPHQTPNRKTKELKDDKGNDPSVNTPKTNKKQTTTRRTHRMKTRQSANAKSN